MVGDIRTARSRVKASLGTRKEEGHAARSRRIRNFPLAERGAVGWLDVRQGELPITTKPRRVSHQMECSRAD
eukprot:6696216-Prymnesium_polylepis.2